MILSNAALVEEYWERLLVLLSEQRRVAGREPLSEQRSEGPPGYLGVSLLHHRRHRAPITATPPTDTAIQPMGIPLTVIRATRSRAIGIQANRGLPIIPVPSTYGYQGGFGLPLPPRPLYGLNKHCFVGAAGYLIITVRIINNETKET
jgi:hypothetical protein